jgi:ketosteroid isomerase-like protein
MISRRRVFMWAMGLVVCLVSAVHGQDLSELKASFAAQIKALDSRNLEAALAQVDNGIVLFGLFSPFPVKGKDAYGQAVEEYFAMYEHATFAPVNSQFRIVETTGVAWGYYELSTKLKDGPPAYFHGRYLFTYTQADGKWRLISMHISPLQLSDMRIHP